MYEKNLTKKRKQSKHTSTILQKIIQINYPNNNQHINSNNTLQVCPEESLPQYHTHQQQVKCHWLLQHKQLEEELDQILQRHPESLAIVPSHCDTLRVEEVVEVNQDHIQAEVVARLHLTSSIILILNRDIISL